MLRVGAKKQIMDEKKMSNMFDNVEWKEMFSTYERMVTNVFMV